MHPSSLVTSGYRLQVVTRPYFATYFAACGLQCDDELSFKNVFECLMRESCESLCPLWTGKQGAAPQSEKAAKSVPFKVLRAQKVASEFWFEMGENATTSLTPTTCGSRVTVTLFSIQQLQSPRRGKARQAIYGIREIWEKLHSRSTRRVNSLHSFCVKSTRSKSPCREVTCKIMNNLHPK